MKQIETVQTIVDLSGNHISDFSPLAGLVENLVEYDVSDQTFSTYNSADVNRDGVVDILDLVLISTHFQNPDFADLDIHPDVNSDGVVDLIDLLLVASEMGSTAAAPALSKNTVETSNLTADKPYSVDPTCQKV